MKKNVECGSKKKWIIKSFAMDKPKEQEEFETKWQKKVYDLLYEEFKNGNPDLDFTDLFDEINELKNKQKNKVALLVIKEALNIYEMVTEHWYCNIQDAIAEHHLNEIEEEL
jgi:hypothetical protein